MWRARPSPMSSSTGGILPLPVGARVTLWAGANVVFVGRAIDTACVLDLLSAESDDALLDDETI